MVLLAILWTTLYQLNLNILVDEGVYSLIYIILVIWWKMISRQVAVFTFMDAHVADEWVWLFWTFIFLHLYQFLDMLRMVVQFVLEGQIDILDVFLNHFS